MRRIRSGWLFQYFIRQRSEQNRLLCRVCCLTYFPHWGQSETPPTGRSAGDDEITLPASVEAVYEDLSHVNITIHEGRFHQVKRMFLTRGKTVTFLKRLSMGSLVLDPALSEGEYRPLTEAEIQQLSAFGGTK